MIFTWIMDIVMCHVRKASAFSVTAFLDDILIKNRDPVRLQQDSLFLLDCLRQLGWKVNLVKSDLTPAQTFTL